MLQKSSRSARNIPFTRELNTKLSVFRLTLLGTEQKADQFQDLSLGEIPTSQMGELPPLKIRAFHSDPRNVAA